MERWNQLMTERNAWLASQAAVEPVATPTVDAMREIEEGYLKIMAGLKVLGVNDPFLVNMTDINGLLWDVMTSK